jgi:hypothetical protein
VTDTSTDTITIEDLAGLESLPVGTKFQNLGIDYANTLRTTETGVRRGFVDSNVEWTKDYVARTHLPAAITNPETLGGFAGVGDRVRIVREYETVGASEFDGKLGVLVEIEQPIEDHSWPFTVKTDDGPTITVTEVATVELAPVPEPVTREPRVGDKVRVVREYKNTASEIDGMVGTLTHISRDQYSSFPYSVDIDGHGPDIVFSVELVAAAEPALVAEVEHALEYAVALDRAGLDALSDNSVIVGIGDSWSKTPLVKVGGSWLKAGKAGTFNYLAGDLLSDQGALVVYQS